MEQQDISVEEQYRVLQGISLVVERSFGIAFGQSLFDGALILRVVRASF